MSNSSLSHMDTLRKHNYDLEKHKLKQEPKKQVFSRQESFLKKFSTRRNANANPNTMISLIREHAVGTAQQSIRLATENLDSGDSPSISASRLSIEQSKSSLPRLSISEQNRFSHSMSNSPIIDFKFSPKKLSISTEHPEEAGTKATPNDQRKDFSTASLNAKSQRKMSSVKSRKSLLPCTATVEAPTLDLFDETKPKSKYKMCWAAFLSRFNYFVFGPDSDCTFFWLTILNLCFLYNIWLIIARQSFENLQIMFAFYWKIADSVSDFIYLIDILVHFRTGYLEQGLLVYDSKKLALNYLKSNKFLLDIFSLAPFELFELYFGYSVPMLRFSRFLKFYRLMELFYIVESRTLYPNVWRVLLLTSILLLLGHWFAGFYFLISKAEGFKGKLTVFF